MGRIVSNTKKTFGDQRLFVTIDNDALENASIVPLAESDGTLKYSMYGKVGSTLTAIALDTNGEQKVVQYGKAGSTITAQKVESTGEQDIVFHGKDSGGTIDPVRTNDNQQLFYELYEKWIAVNPYELTTSDAVAWDPGTTAADLYRVIITVHNFTATTRQVSVYRDLGGTGTEADNEKLMAVEDVAANSRVSLPAIIMTGADNIRAYVDGSGANAVNLHFEVKQVSRT